MFVIELSFLSAKLDDKKIENNERALLAFIIIFVSRVLR